MIFLIQKIIMYKFIYNLLLHIIEYISFIIYITNILLSFIIKIIRKLEENCHDLT